DAARSRPFAPRGAAPSPGAVASRTRVAVDGDPLGCSQARRRIGALAPRLARHVRGQLLRCCGVRRLVVRPRGPDRIDARIRDAPESEPGTRIAIVNDDSCRTGVEHGALAWYALVGRIQCVQSGAEHMGRESRYGVTPAAAWTL